uniref:GDSL esterase/lipase n=1 Tax=Zea mays TaxID=4577 RepID=A0A804QU84_MAIZE
MEMRVVLLLCQVICMQAAVIGAVAAAAGARPPAMYVFGSSILDVGNNNYLRGPAVGRANSPYNGVDFPGSIPTGRFSNGYNIADYVAKSMGFACSPPPYLSLAQAPAPAPAQSSGPDLAQTALTIGINYASGGAGILDSTNAGNTIPLSEEVKYFGATKAKMVAAAGPSAVNPLISRSIFLIGMGNNDLYVFGASERARNRSDAEQRRDAAAALYASLVSNYSAAVTEVRRHQRVAARMRAGGARAQPDGRVLRRPQRRRRRLQRRPALPAHRPRREAAGPRLRPRRLLRLHAGRPGGPARVRVHRRRKHVLRRRAAAGRGGLVHAQLHALRRP